jgi:hypothetical protein
MSEHPLSDPQDALAAEFAARIPEPTPATAFSPLPKVFVVGEKPIDLGAENVPPVKPFTPVPIPTLRSLAKDFLAALDAADQPYTQRLAADPELRRSVIRHLGVVRGYRDELLDLGVAPWITWTDLKDSDAISSKNKLVEQAAEDEEVIEAVIGASDFDILTENFPKELAAYAKEAVGDMDVDELIESIGAKDLAENDDVKNAVLNETDVDEILEYLDAEERETLAAKRLIREAVMVHFSFADAELAVRYGNVSSMASEPRVRARVFDSVTHDEAVSLKSTMVREEILKTLDKADIEFAIASNPSLVQFIVSTRVMELATAASHAVLTAEAALSAAKEALVTAQREIAGLRS